MGLGSVGDAIRTARLGHGWTQVDLAHRLHVTRSTVSRWEARKTCLDIPTLRRLAAVLDLPPQLVGLAAEPLSDAAGVMDDDPVRRRHLLTSLAVTAAATAVPGGLVSGTARAAMPAGDSGLPDALRSLLLGTSVPAGPLPSTAGQARALLGQATNAFHSCRYADLGRDLPAMIVGTQRIAGAADDRFAYGLLAQAYILATRLLIKLEEVDLGLLAADRAHTFASGGGNAALVGEAARNKAVLVRKAGWHDDAAAIALQAADHLTGTDPGARAERGLLLMSAGYTAAKSRDAATLTDLTEQARRIADGLGDRLLLPTHGGGFSRALVDLHLISGYNAVGDPRAALAVADRVRLGHLPTVERRARCLTDVATSHALLGRRAECVDTLLRAERIAPQEVRARPAVRRMVGDLTATGRISPDLRGLAARLRLP
ncbi:helix-turn-helix transcriptional regulator [Actinomadura rupiterrae]|uniref:helix-turn-helix transcriptional regulator n=1 Tax=Actinomadura rupiterrae TaxID=559627 RepID=UPI0020A4F855|nr:helix-turn-helix transcriptional regulator [Actinomadura rupiterrae]MCP2341157.1 transcriptional regulator with XRE-family HTH domain [Actinomadura rupiterrae]